MDNQPRIGVIGGSGLYDIEGLTAVSSVRVKTPFGDPSDEVVLGTLEGRRLAFLPRHGRGHRINPSQLPARANIFALKSLGVERVISISAVGSLKEEVRPMDMVVPDQIIDRTRGRPSTFFEDGVVVHIAFADPFCPVLSPLLAKNVEREGVRVHRGGTYVAMEGPQFSTRAESNLYRSWGATIIGMTALPEAKLAREAEMCYAVLACSTDYDCWHPEHESVTVDMIISNLLKNTAHAKSILRRVVAEVPTGTCSCHSALANAIVTSREAIPPHVARTLAPLLGKYIKA
jgi:5'-methylthioadenosine phosphorylase